MILLSFIAVIQSTDAMMSLHGVPLTRSTDNREFVCGWGAASVNIVSTFPINKLMFRQQLSGIHASTALQQLKHEGIGLLYRGVLPPLLQKTTSLSIMFGMYDVFNRNLSYQFPALPEKFCQATAAVLAGCLEASLTPFERVQTLLQAGVYHKRYRNTTHIIHDLGKKYGVREYFRGYSAILVRNGPSNAVFFILRDELKAHLPVGNTSSSEVARDFVSGGILGAFISTLFFPVNVAKTRMQRNVGVKFESFLAAFVGVYRERNRSIMAMFRGVHINCLRSLLSWGIINSSYELLKKLLYNDS